MPPTDPEPITAPQPRRRRWWSLSVRGLMLLVLVFGGLVGWEASRVARMRRAVATVQGPVADLPGSVIAGGAIAKVLYADRLGSWEWLNARAPGAVGWFRRWIGDDHFRRVSGFWFQRRPTPADWDAIRALGTVEVLNFSDSGATDDDLAPVADCPGLRVLSVASFSVTDRTLAAVGRIATLRKLNLWLTNVTGVGTAALAGLANLEELMLPDHRDADASLIHLGHLTNLRALGLGRVSDRGLAALRGNTHLEYLSFKAWQMTDAGWADLTSLRNLKVLRIKPVEPIFVRTPSGQPQEGRPITLSPESAGSLGRLARLERLEFRDLGDDTWLAALGPLARLRMLDFGGDWVTDASLATVGNLTQLENLQIHGDRITDAGLAPLGRLVHLDILDIDSPGVTDAGLRPLTTLTRLQALSLHAHVSAEGMATLRAALPGITYVLNRRYPEPAPPAAPP